MFKVPEWGNDIPKSNVEVFKSFTKNNKNKNTKSNAQPKSKDNVVNRKNNGNKKNDNAHKKVKKKLNGHTILSKDDHINNRILRRNLKVTSADITNRHKTITENCTGKATLKGNKFTPSIDVNNKLKNKLLKRKGKVSKLASDLQKNEANKSGISKKNMATKIINNFDKEPEFLKRKQELNCEIHEEVNITDVGSLNNEPDKILVNAKRKQIDDKIKKDDVEDILFSNMDSNEELKISKLNVVAPSKQSKAQKKKEKLKEILKSSGNRNIIRTNSNKLRERMLERLKAAQFRYLNEKLYTSSGSESQELFKSDPAAFQTYHEGYQLQVKKWPVNPLDLIVKRIQKMPKTHLIADMGCGEAALSKRLLQSVRSFDLVATEPGVEACNMAHTPLLAASMDVVVFCLALMGTDLTQYLLEANRVLKIGGHLLIAEVESRFENVDSFSGEVQRLGFSLKKLDESHQVFFCMEFSKVREAPSKRGKLPSISLKPCLYRKR